MSINLFLSCIAILCRFVFSFIDSGKSTIALTYSLLQLRSKVYYVFLGLLDVYVPFIVQVYEYTMYSPYYI